MIVLLDLISRLKGNTFHMGDGFFKLKVNFNEYISFYPFLDTTQLLNTRITGFPFLLKSNQIYCIY